MDRSGRLRLDLFDACGDPLNERVDIYLQNQSVTDTVAVRGVLASKAIVIKNLLAPPNGLYRIFIDPPSYLPVSLFVNASGTRLIERAIAFAIDPDKVIRVEFPSYPEIGYAHPVLEASGGTDEPAGQKLYDGLDSIRRAGLLNVLAKCRRTPLGGGSIVLGFLTALKEIRGDRIFARVAGDLHGRILDGVAAGSFREVSGALHKHPGFEPAGSYKTNDTYGNLQVTLFTRGNETVADIDIDDAAGLEHVFQVARNALSGRPTHPYNIHNILLRHQEIDPGYRFVLHEDSHKTRVADQKG